jgi:hypothetical protein
VRKRPGDDFFVLRYGFFFLPEARQVMEHYKPLFDPGKSDPARVLPPKVFDLPDFLSGFAIWNHAR